MQSGIDSSRLGPREIAAVIAMAVVADVAFQNQALFRPRVPVRRINRSRFHAQQRGKQSGSAIEIQLLRSDSGNAGFPIDSKVFMTALAGSIQ